MCKITYPECPVCGENNLSLDEVGGYWICGYCYAHLPAGVYREEQEPPTHYLENVEIRRRIKEQMDPEKNILGYPDHTGLWENTLKLLRYLETGEEDFKVYH